MDNLRLWKLAVIDLMFIMYNNNLFRDESVGFDYLFTWTLLFFTYSFSEITPEGRRITKLDQILLNGNNITMVRQPSCCVSVLDRLVWVGKGLQN